ncbi:carboxymuconolactone decarboxylase family protein [Campylobacter jejuni]|uniref:carboxymuconolactone decarboxylase family protein n=1 Tax=Campylobacter jejuni TaxID=197 RepID=UPI0012842A82|nr:carboxymuconolactone decarboxylase family protein [Campylobacter jejuni]HEE9547552.1 carboxymuconolactone decarboxylase family protein [Campylobacter jejuni subsp. jejuni]EAL4826141.1 carboxymuconolactone decarboxylase family protein [Campylobacter jejuni]EAL5889572.1 carboxymuconolactone decarboxylase family protein [Campylobacter jejuni]ECL3373601.1 carboxymuconolactone decarboxylase family protein [Campylobacter jejuni]ECP8787964.1 carboxymuconolactone decarboxylase family protein [Campy
MQLRQKAREIFEKLLGEVKKDQLFASDKEYFINHINFTFGESFVKANLDTQKYFLITLASTLAVGGKIEFKALLQGAIKNDISPIVIKEVIYQATPYVGFSRVCDFLSLCNKVFKKLNIALVLTPQGATTQENRKIKGREIQNAIFSEANITKMIESTPEDKAFINDFLSANCFDYTRMGLDLKTRELLTLVYLISLGGLDNQVKAHIQGNLNMGQSRKDLLNIIAALIPYIGYPKALNALNLLDDIKK